MSFQHKVSVKSLIGYEAEPRSPKNRLDDDDDAELDGATACAA